VSALAQRFAATIHVTSSKLSGTDVVSLLKPSI
jgi:hypothetical protein